MAGIGGDFYKKMAVRKVFAGEAVLLRAKDEGDAATAGQLRGDAWSEVGERDDRLLGLAVGEGSGAKDQRGLGNGFSQQFRGDGVLELTGGADGRFGFAPVGFVRGDYGKMGEAEVGKGSCGGTYIEGVAWMDQDDGEAVALGFGEQESIVATFHLPSAVELTAFGVWSGLCGIPPIPPAAAESRGMDRARDICGPLRS